jgi:hypothetical protein
MSVQTKSMKLVLSMIMLSGDGWVSRSELSIGNSFYFNGSAYTDTLEFSST